MVFTHDLLVLTLRWVDFAMNQVAGWTDSSTGGDPSRINQLLEAMLAEHSTLVAPATT